MTAIEFLWDMLLKGEFINDPEELFNQAKAMEKEQIIRAHLMARCYDTPNSYNEAEQYYNETYDTYI